MAADDLGVAEIRHLGGDLVPPHVATGVPADLAAGSARALAIKAARNADPASPPNQVIRLLRLAKEPLTAREIAEAQRRAREWIAASSRFSKAL